MEMGRRRVLIGLSAVGLLPTAALAQGSGRLAFLTTGRESRGFLAAGLDAEGRVVFEARLPARGHGIAVAPGRERAVVFARRPGRFALVLDLAAGAAVHRFEAPDGRHFFGHGAFSADGRRLFATENAYDAETGVLGVYDAANGYARTGEIALDAVGPHEIIRMRDGGTLAVAVGGILTHPDFPRRKLNLSTMRPGLLYVDIVQGRVVERVGMPRGLDRLSLRHIAEARGGALWWGGQYQGPKTDAVPLAGLHRRGDAALTVLDDTDGVFRGFDQYCGSVAAAADGRLVAVTSPRGGKVALWNAVTGALARVHDLTDVCAAAPLGAGFAVTTGLGDFTDLNGHRARGAVQWDNHMAAVESAIGQIRITL